VEDENKIERSKSRRESTTQNHRRPRETGRGPENPVSTVGGKLSYWSSLKCALSADRGGVADGPHQAICAGARASLRAKHWRLVPDGIQGKNASGGARKLLRVRG
jgi:hypothetical protein